MGKPLSVEQRSLLVMLLTEPDARPSSLARRLGVSRQAVFYWLRRLREEGLIGPPMVYVRPDVLGLYYAFFKTAADPPPDSVLKFYTLDGDVIFAVPFKTPSQLEDLYRAYGQPWFVPNLRPRYISELQKRALELFVNNPEVRTEELAEELGVTRHAARRLSLWIRRNVNFFYKVDISAAGVYALAVRTRAPPASLAPYKFFRCYAYAVGFYALAFEDLRKAAAAVSMLKASDPKTAVYVVVDYEVSVPKVE
ncbi:MAG: helix-turn-helix domain-containing protein [Pyrobaculum sp.]